MKKILAIVLGVFLVTFLSGIVYAADGANSTPQGLFGQCVAQKAEIKNSCFAANKSTLATCKAPAKEVKDKVAKKLCKQTYKLEKKQCKITFKTAKEQCRELKNSTAE